MEMANAYAQALDFKRLIRPITLFVLESGSEGDLIMVFFLALLFLWRGDKQIRPLPLYFRILYIYVIIIPPSNLFLLSFRPLLDIRCASRWSNCFSKS